MGIAPSLAVPKLLQRTGLTVQDIDILEMNEAFGTMAVYCADQIGIDRERVNPKCVLLFTDHTAH